MKKIILLLVVIIFCSCEKEQNCYQVCYISKKMVTDNPSEFQLIQEVVIFYKPDTAMDYQMLFDCFMPKIGEKIIESTISLVACVPQTNNTWKFTFQANKWWRFCNAPSSCFWYPEDMDPERIKKDIISSKIKELGGIEAVDTIFVVMPKI